MFGIVRFFYRIFFRPSAWVLGYCLLPFSNKLRQLYRCWQRFPSELRAVALKSESTHAAMRVWVHAASIGEFESTRWIIEDLMLDPTRSILLTYSSPSLEEHLSRHPKLLDHPRFTKLFFPLDDTKRLIQIKRVYKPTDFILLQYDYWPNLMSVVLDDFNLSSRSILNYAPPPESGLTNLVKMSYLHRILNNFTFIHQCSETPQRPLLSPDINLITLAPHTRWAMLQIEAEIKHEVPGEFMRVVGGNTHASDLKFLQAMFGYIAPLNYQLIWVPHEINERNLKTISKQLGNLCQKYSIVFRKHDSLQDILSDHSPGVILVTGFGFLKELYQNAHLAYVGGGYNAKGIHNVIEPLSWGCPVVSGPNIYRQPVARWAKQEGYLKVGNNTIDSYYAILGTCLVQGVQHETLREQILDKRKQMKQESQEISKYLPVYTEIT